jgi:hypothetical protein
MPSRIGAPAMKTGALNCLIEQYRARRRLIELTSSLPGLARVV